VQGPDDRVHLLLRSASAPGEGLWRFADPLVRIAQIVYRRRYARALRVLSQEPVAGSVWLCERDCRFEKSV
jgi:hypothetical protein